MKERISDRYPVVFSILLGIFLMKRHKISKVVLAGFVAIPIGFWTHRSQFPLNNNVFWYWDWTE